MLGRKTISVLLMMLTLFMAGTVRGALIKINITDDNDDVEERLDRDNVLDMGSSDVEMPYEDPGQEDLQVVGLRFPGVEIPQGTTITNAYLQFQVDEDKGGTEPVNVIIQGELAADAAGFVNVPFNVTDRARTTAQVAWSVPNWTNVGDRGPEQQTPDLADIIQEIVNQADWASGNALVLIISDDPNHPSTGIRCAEAGPGDDSATLVIEAFVPFARNPVPASGATEVKDLTVAQWTAADGAVAYDIYISGDETIEEDDFVSTIRALEDPEFVLPEAPLPGVTYYWRVDAVDANGVVSEGAVWNLTTYPLEAHFPSPPDGALWVKVDAQLGWTEGLDALVHNVFLSTDQALVEAKDPNVQVGQWVSVPTFNPGALMPNTTYFWAVDEFLGADTNPGPIWSFTTGDPNEGGVLAQYWDNQNLEGAPALITTESEVNWDFNAERNSQPHPDVPVTDHFSARWTADLQIPVDGPYTFYVASDDGSRLFLNGEEIIGSNWSDHGTQEAASDPLELMAGADYLLEMEMYENGGGATAYLRWEGPGIPKQIIPQGALQIPEFPLYPTPAAGATGVNDTAMLSWIPGPSAVQHDVYLGTDPDLVAAGDASVYMGRIGNPYGIDIPVPDAGFDDHVLENVGDWMYLGDPNYTGAWLNRLPGDAAWVDYGYFAADGDLPALSGNNKLFATYPEGVEDYVYQILDETFIEGATYTLSVWVGLAWDGYSDGWSLKLTGDDPENNLAEVSGTAPVGSWEQVSLVYTATAADAGKKIGIKIETTAEYVTFDDVTLSYVPGINSFDPGLIPWNTVYYWRVDAVDVNGMVTPSWSVWEFTTQSDQVLEDFTSYDIDPEMVVIDPNDPNAIPIDPNDPNALVIDPALNLVSGVWGAGIIVEDPNQGQVMCLMDGEAGSLALDADIQGADTLAVPVSGDGNVSITVTDADGAQNNLDTPAPADWQPVKLSLGGLNRAAIARITIKATGGMVCVAEIKATADHQVVLKNPSFEQPGTVKHRGFGDVPGWNTDSEPVASGVEAGYGATDGYWTAYLKGRDPAIWNLTNQTIRAAGETFILTLDARRIVTGSAYDGAQKLTIVVYYDDNGTRVPLSTQTVGLETSMQSFTVTFTAPADSEAIGKTLGIELSNKVSLYVGVDNLALVRKYLDGVDN